MMPEGGLADMADLFAHELVCCSGLSSCKRMT